MFPLPLYGHYHFGEDLSVEVLVSRLKQISSQFLNNKPFSAYLTIQSGETFYGLDYDELTSRYASEKAEAKTISLSVSTPAQQVIRIHIRFEPVIHKAKSQFVIAAGDAETNLEIKALLTGAPYKRPKRHRVSKPVPVQSTSEQEITEITYGPSDPVSHSSLTHRRTTILLSDAFYFDQNISIYPLLAVLDELSDKYMDYQSFHAQLETTDGDFHFDIQREELRYMFNQRRHTLLNLYFYNSNRDGHWIDMALSFHPLAEGSNAELEICSAGSQIDDISDLIKDAIAIPPPEPIEGLEASFSFDPSGFTIERFISLFQHISFHFVFRIPPVAHVKTYQQKAFTGLSFFQLEKLYKDQGKYVEVLKVEMVHHATGQMCRAEVEFPEESTKALCNIEALLGDETRQQKIRDLVMDRMGAI